MESSAANQWNLLVQSSSMSMCERWQLMVYCLVVLFQSGFVVTADFRMRCTYMFCKEIFGHVLLQLIFIIGRIIIVRWPIGYYFFFFLGKTSSIGKNYRGESWFDSSIVCLWHHVTSLCECIRMFMQFEVFHKINFIDLKYLKHIQKDHSCHVWVCFFLL